MSARRQVGTTVGSTTSSSSARKSSLSKLMSKLGQMLLLSKEQPACGARPTVAINVAPSDRSEPRAAKRGSQSVCAPQAPAKSSSSSSSAAASSSSSVQRRPRGSLSLTEDGVHPPKPVSPALTAAAANAVTANRRKVNPSTIRSQPPPSLAAPYNPSPAYSTQSYSAQSYSAQSYSAQSYTTQSYSAQSPPAQNMPTASKASSAAANANTQSTGAQKLCCDKCDGPHETDHCPYFKKKRDDHPDAQRGNKALGSTSLLPGAYFALHEARVIRQPGDGSCLFHSLSHGLGGGLHATRLRAEICQFISNNPSLSISDTPLRDWVKWDAGSSVQNYVRKMSRGSWGGGIEMAAFSIMKQVNVHVYERVGSGYKRISAFDVPVDARSRPTVRVLYQGGVHYDALVV